MLDRQWYPLGELIADTARAPGRGAGGPPRRGRGSGDAAAGVPGLRAHPAGARQPAGERGQVLARRRAHPRLGRRRRRQRARSGGGRGAGTPPRRARPRVRALLPGDAAGARGNGRRRRTAGRWQLGRAAPASAWPCAPASSRPTAAGSGWKRPRGRGRTGRRCHRERARRPRWWGGAAFVFELPAGRATSTGRPAGQSAERHGRAGARHRGADRGAAHVLRAARATQCGGVPPPTAPPARRGPPVSALRTRRRPRRETPPPARRRRRRPSMAASPPAVAATRLVQTEG